jgi:hypothetical protein
LPLQKHTVNHCLANYSVLRTKNFHGRHSAHYYFIYTLRSEIEYAIVSKFWMFSGACIMYKQQRNSLSRTTILYTSTVRVKRWFGEFAADCLSKEYDQSEGKCIRQTDLWMGMFGNLRNIKTASRRRDLPMMQTTFCKNPRWPQMITVCT